MKTRIITDSTADLTPELKERLHIVPLNVIFDALLLKYMEDSKHVWDGNVKELRYVSIGSVIGTHAGPGAIAVAFFKK